MPIIDDYKNFTPSIEGPVAGAGVITPDDTTDLARMTRAIYVGGAGDIRVTMSDSTVLTFAGIATGWHPIRVSRIHATGTTATNIIGCW